MTSFWSKRKNRPDQSGLKYSLARTYQVISSASVEDLWRKLGDLTDVSWHPILASTNVPRGLVAKPGLMYRAMTRLWPVPIQIFVERVAPGQLLSVRILAIPGVEERVTYTLKSSVLGSQISYSVVLRGWLSPLVWSLLRPYAARVATRLAQSAEQAMSGANASGVNGREGGCWDF